MVSFSRFSQSLKLFRFTIMESIIDKDPVAEMFIRIPAPSLCEIFSHTVVTEQRLFTNICPPISIDRYSFTQLHKLRQHGENEIAQVSKLHNKDSNPGILTASSEFYSNFDC